MIKNYINWINENSHTHEAATPELLKSLGELGKGLNTEQDIVDAITSLGFERKNIGAEKKTADYLFVDPEGNSKKYISYTTGYVRYNELGKTGWRGTERVIKTPVSRALFTDVKDRLLLILRIALKNTNLYNMWKKSKLPIKEFIQTKKHTIAAKKFGI